MVDKDPMKKTQLAGVLEYCAHGCAGYIMFENHDTATHVFGSCSC